jgi:hypothetical protein
MTDVKAFDRAVDRLSMARDMQSRGPHQLSKDIMTKYAKEDQGKRLTPSDVWSAVGSLSEKPHLTRVEKEELDILKATQNQMRAMWPSGGEPANHHSRAHQNYVEQINRLPLAEADLTRNVNDVIDQYQGNRAVYDTLAVVRNGHHQMIEGDRSPMVEARPLPSPPPIPQPRQ